MLHSILSDSGVENRHTRQPTWLHPVVERLAENQDPVLVLRTISAVKVRLRIDIDLRIENKREQEEEEEEEQEE
ncbi:hypothetical protein SDJN02_06809, partial [Cucurbita argyrosperma subsp. argyrosperma]